MAADPINYDIHLFIGCINIVSFCGGRRMPAFSICLFGLLAVAVVAVSGSYSGGSSSDYNVYNYDRMTPQFTPDGRLLQVEYATAASDHSCPLLLCELDDQTIVLMTLKKHAIAQNRIVPIHPLPGYYYNNNNKCSSSSSMVVVAMSGVLADNVALLKTAWKEYLNVQATYGGGGSANSVVGGAITAGSSSTFCLRTIVTAIGNACQKHSAGGGIRPYGSQMLVCGLGDDHDDDYNSNNGDYDDDGDIISRRSSSSEWQIYQTDPSGAVYNPILQQQLQQQKTRKRKDKRTPLLTVLGGPSAIRQNIIKQIKQKLPLLHDDDDDDDDDEEEGKKESVTIVRKRLQVLAGILLKQQDQQQNTFDNKKHNNNKKKSTPTNKQQQNANTNNNHEETENEEEEWWMEVVLLSKTHGVHRLTDSQIRALLVQARK